MKTLLIALLFCCGVQASATNYYFSSSAGDDSRSFAEAQSAFTPWKTIQKLNNIFSSLTAGDTVFFKKGETFYGSLNIGSSGTQNAPIVLSSFGSGAQPIISGFSSLTTWTSIGNGIWETTVPVTVTGVNLVTIDGQSKAMGRYPNYSEANKGYLTIDSHSGSTQITDNELTSGSNWATGDIVIRKNRWEIERGPIAQHNGSSLTYSLASGAEPSDNFGYFIQNHASTLDQAGEWYFNTTTNKLLVYFGNTNPGTSIINVTTVDNLVVLQGKSNIVFDNLSFQGSNAKTFLIQSATNISIKNCTILFSAIDAVYSENAATLTIQNSTIENSNNSAVICYTCQNTSITSNTIKNVGIYPGMGKASGLYTGISVTGSDHTIEYNKFDSVGYVPIDFSGDNVLIKNNFINHFGFIKDDGAGIYTWNGFTPLRWNSNRKIIGNIILNGIGAGAGTNSPGYAPMHGIYMDDKTGNVEITNNTVAYCGLGGIYLHNAHDLSVENNTLFNNEKQLILTSDEYSGGVLIRNLVIKNNILFSKTADQYVAYSVTDNNDLNSMGVFDQNYYCRPADDNFIFYTSYKNNGNLVSSSNDFAQWKSLTNQDGNSKRTPFKNPSYKVNALKQAKFNNEYFNSSLSDLSVWSQSGNCITSWNSSKIDGGTLQLSFNSLTSSTNTAYVTFYIGAVEAGKTYVLTLDMLSTTSGKYAKAFLRKVDAPYTTLSNVERISITDTLSAKEIVFTAATSESNSCVILEVGEQSEPIWIDNLQLNEAVVSPITPDDYIRFVYNASTSTQTFSLDASYSDMKSNWYTGSIDVAPYSSAVLMAPYGMILLPFRFNEFNATSNDNTITLRWNASNENKIREYQIEGSENGSSFKYIGKASANSGASQSYVYNTNTNNFTYYRIKAIEETGSLHYSKTLKITTTRKMDLWVTNPATTSLDVMLPEPLKENGIFSLYAADGSLLKTVPVKAQTSRFSFDIHSLAKGSYLASLESGNYRSNRLFLKN